MTKLSNIEAIYPLAPLQRGLLFNSMYSPGSGAYVQQLRMTICGPLNSAGLRKSWEAIVDKHSSLRTSFVWEDQEEPVQIVRRRVAVPWQEHDWRTLDEHEQRSKLEDFLLADRHKGFNFNRAPLLRLTCFRTGEQTYELVATNHHIIVDGWSCSVLIRDLLRFMRNVNDGAQEETETKPKSDYKSYVQWVQQQNPGRAESFWRKSLRGTLEPTVVPEMQPGDVHGDAARQMSHKVHLGGEVREVLKKFGAACGVTLTTVLAGTWALLLSCCNNREDVVFGLTVSGRPPSLPGVEDIVGLFINTLPLRIGTDPQKDIAEWFRELQGAMLELQDHSYSDLIDIRKWSDMASGRPLFESIFIFDNYPAEDRDSTQTSGLSFNNIHSIDNGSFPLAVIAGVNQGIDIAFTYDSSRMSESSAKRLLDRYSTMLCAIPTHAGRPISAVSALSEDERRQVLRRSEGTRRDFGVPLCIHRLFEEQALNSPAAIALSLDERQWTYQQLNERSNQIANYLVHEGVLPEHRVGIRLRSPAEVVMAILGVLKAGGAYVPLDPSYPTAILSHIVRDASLRMVITENEVVAQLPQGGARVVNLSAEWNEINRQPTSAPHTAGVPDNLAYVIYTSGSTGMPKGVAVAHQNAFNTIQWVIENFSIDTSDKLLLGVSTSFDPSVAQIFSALCSGAELRVMKSSAYDVRYILGLIESHRLTQIDLPPSILALVISEAKAGQLQSVKRVLSGGETMPASLPPSLFSKLRIPLTNMYGPTETCINASSWTCTAASFVPPVAIGRAIANAQLYVLDAYLQPVPKGVAGELYIGGSGVARGYLNRPDLTADKFIPDPYCDKAGSRLYRTGDLARVLPDDNIEFLGRIDSQVKIRGMRIELGQVEAAIKEHPAVVEVAVAVRRNLENEPLLVAYLGTKLPLSKDELSAFLETKLPGAMVPSIFLFLDELPRMVNGKVNHQSLPPIDFGSTQETQKTPRDEWQRLLAAIWTNLLRLSDVGVNDNFFALGGHSLTAMRVVSKVREVFGIDLPLHVIFEKPTISQLGTELQSRAQKAIGPVLPVVPHATGNTAPMSFPQQRLWFLDRLAPGQAFYNLPEALRFQGPLDRSALEQALREIKCRHSILRTVFAVEQNELVQVVSEDCDPSVNFFDISAVDESERESQASLLAERDAQNSFDLEHGPLFRITLLRLASDDHILLLTFHHIVADGWSVGIVTGELSTLYKAFHERTVNPLPEQQLQYADFARWELERSGDTGIGEGLTYWESQLAGSSGVLALPTDFPRPATQTFYGSSCPFLVPASTVESIKGVALRESVTPFMFLLAAFQTLLYRYSGQTDILVGSPVSGRVRPEFDSLAGLFVNTIVLRTDFSGDPSFRELLRTLRSTTLGAYSHQDVPFDKLIEHLRPARDLSRSPLFQVMFSFQQSGGDETKLDFGELHAMPFNVTAGTSKFDLELLMTQSPSGLSGVLEYNTDLFCRETIEAMVGHFLTLLEHAAKTVEGSVSRLPILTDHELRELVDHVSAGRKTSLPRLCVHQLFETQANETPNSMAVVGEDGSLTYRELNNRANSLAHGLIRSGLSRESVVAVLAGRGSDLLCSMLGIWKAGGAYLPLDAKYPARRLARMLEQARIKHIIVTPDWTELLDEVLPELKNTDITVWNSDELLDTPTATNPTVPCAPENLAYVIFTSGSTGIPKGSMVEHKGMLNHLFAKISDLNLTSEDAVAQTASQCFDISIWQFLSALMVGGRTQVWSDLIAYNPIRLLEELDESGVSILEVVPSLLRLLLDELERAPKLFTLASLRWLVPTGEALPPDLVHRWHEHYPSIPLMNAYGPTECSDDVLHFPIHERLAAPATSVPIGRPICNMSFYLLDASMEPVPAGVPGELFISGIGVGRGYIHSPEQTAQVFCPNPFPSDPNERLYRTGDRARLLRDGTLDFLGRADQQVKIRGFRIELGEIEYRLRQHIGVRDCVVIDNKDAERNTQLVGYVVLDQPGTSVEELRKFLRLNMPDYMVPSLILFLDAIPLTSAGKVDRRALPAPDQTSAIRPTFAAPETEIERRLARVWESLLQVHPVGTNDNFFDLGGHSILALRLMGEIQNRFGRKLPLTALFQHGTIKELAGILQESFSLTPSSPLIAMQPNGSNPPLFFVHVGTGEVMCYLDLVRHLGPDQPFFGLQDPNLYAHSIVEMSIEKRASLYIEVVRSVQPAGPYLLGGWSFGGLVAFEMARQLRLADEQVALLALLDTGSPDFMRQMTYPDDDAALLGIIARELNLRVTDAELGTLSLEDKYQFVAAHMKNAGIQWADAVDFLARQLGIFKSRNRMIQQYYPSPYDGLITFFRASQQYVEGSEQNSELLRDSSRGFSLLTTQPIDMYIVPGNHHEIAREPGVRDLAAALSRAIEKALFSPNGNSGATSSLSTETVVR